MHVSVSDWLMTSLIHLVNNA